MAFSFLICRFFPLAIVLGGGLATASADQTTKLSAGGKVQNLIALNVASLFDGSSATLSQMDIADSNLESCLMRTISKLDVSVPGGLAAPFLFLSEEDFCSPGSFSNCDFAGTAFTAFFEQAEDNCAAGNGMLLTEELYFCDEEFRFGTIDDDFFPPDFNVKLSNIPVCVDQACPEDTTYRRLLRLLFDLAPDDDNENAFTGQCAPIEIEWKIPSTRYEDRSTKVGNTIVFNYGLFHNVYIHPSGGCDETESILVGATGGPASYTFTTDDAGKIITFACDIGMHCEAGQIISFKVEEVPTAAPTVSPITMAPTATPTMLSPEDFKAGIDNEDYDIILDVRSQAEWDSGHIVGSTFAENLADFGSPFHTGAIPSDFEGCEFCSLAVYCRSGSRAMAAIQVLLNNGFQGRLYNGQGIIQWTNAGYRLVTDDSVVPKCTTSDEDICIQNRPPLMSVSPSNAPSDAMIDKFPIRKVPGPDGKEMLKMKRFTSSFETNTMNGIRGSNRRTLSKQYPPESKPMRPM